MRKFNYVEIMDCAWFPNFMRENVQDLLEVMSTRSPIFDRIIPLIQKVMQKADTTEILDLCSGGGGPWFNLLDPVSEKEPKMVLTFSDLFPNTKTINKVAKKYRGKVNYLPYPLDATNVSKDLEGVRTFFGGFHHMKPSVARKILNDAAESRKGIIVAEAYMMPPKISWITLPLQLLFSPLYFLHLWVKYLKVMRGKPLTVIARILFTYIIPICPLVVIFDTFISSVRVYMKQDLEELTSSIHVHGYKWEIDRLDPENGLPPLVYVIGYPE